MTWMCVCVQSQFMHMQVYKKTPKIKQIRYMDALCVFMFVRACVASWSNTLESLVETISTLSLPHIFYPLTSPSASSTASFIAGSSSHLHPWGKGRVCVCVCVCEKLCVNIFSISLQRLVVLAVSKLWNVAASQRWIDSLRSVCVLTSDAQC